MPETEFWRAFKELCDQNGTSPNAVAKELGLASGSITAWKNGRKPHFETIGRLASYFGVDMGVFYGLAETEKVPTGEPAGATEEQIRFALFDGGEISDEGYAKVVEFAKMVQALERQQKLNKKNNE